MFLGGPGPFGWLDSLINDKTPPRPKTIKEKLRDWWRYDAGFYAFVLGVPTVLIGIGFLLGAYLK